MKRKVFVLMVMGFVLFLSSCASFSITTYEKMMNTWIGCPADELFLSWGPPTGTQDLKDGKTIVVYKFSTVGGYNGNTPTWYCNITFILENDTVTKWDWECNLGGAQRFVKARSSHG